MANEKPSIPKEVFEKGLLQFRKYDCHVIRNLKDNTISFGDRRNFNDPFDCNLPINLCSEGEWQKYLLKFPPKDHLGSPAFIAKRAKELALNPQKAKSEIESLIYDHRRFSCFTIASEERLFFNSLFWSNYADKHAGICLKFNGKLLVENFLTNHIQPILVEYCNDNKIPDFNYIRNKLNGSKKLASKYFLGTKSSQWAKEGELRFIHLSPEKILPDYIVKKFIPECLEEVYLGCKFELEKVDEIKKILSNSKYKNVKLFGLKKDNKHFRLIPEQVKIH
ncbi:DUF2971 domain-containing protein [Sunxiuqinia rutila]|uniref:DUF2971 domain-containing protein n=1 Tax=Sunxiuqinia rutila TaxID=1397841 RepID=UPI003D361EC3